MVNKKKVLTKSAPFYLIEMPTRNYVVSISGIAPILL